MPIHDWTRVTACTWHDFHLCWISELRNALNGGLLPEDYYAQAEQVIQPCGPDVLALQETHSSDDSEEPYPLDSDRESGGIALAMTRPKMRFSAQTEMEDYVAKRRVLTIRQASRDRIVALVELLSPGNKSNHNAFQSFVDKAVECLSRGYHLLIADLFPPTSLDPNGVHGAIWNEIGDKPYTRPAGEPLTLVAYSAGQPKTAYIEPVAVGRDMIDMPLFLTPEMYINVPLEATYQAAYRGVPRKWRQVLETA